MGKKRAMMKAGPDRIEWRARPDVELDATMDKELLFFGDPRNRKEWRAYQARLKRVMKRRMRDPRYGEDRLL